MPRYCLALDLKDDPQLIAEYERHHHPIPAPIAQSIRDSGITNLQIYRIGNRLFMILETTNDFSFAQKAAADASNARVQAWEQLMWTFQQPLALAQPGEKWLVMTELFDLNQPNPESGQ